VIKKILLCVIATLIVCSAAVYFFIFTTPGSILAVKWAIRKFSKSENVKFDHARGNIGEKFTLKNVRVTGLRGMPEYSVVIIRQIDIWFEKFSPDGLHIGVMGGSSTLPTSEQVLFYGTYAGGLFDFNIYSKNAGLDSLMPFLGRQKPSVSIKGNTANIDLLLKGSVQDFALKGTAIGQRLMYKSFLLTDAAFVFDLFVINKPENKRVTGAVIVKRGRIAGPNTAIVDLKESKLTFSGDVSKPRLDIKGKSMVGQTEIRISVSGTAENPDIKLFSEPPLPQEQLLVMLATGKQWSGVDTAFSKGDISPDLAMDFFDYFVLGGAGSEMARKFGITGFSVTLDGTKKGVGVRGSLFDRAEVGYGVIQTKNEGKAPEITQKLSGEFKVTDVVSVTGEREFRQLTASDIPSDGKAANDTVMIKFKKSF
jgi:hypothetical protein